MITEDVVRGERVNQCMQDANLSDSVTQRGRITEERFVVSNTISKPVDVECHTVNWTPLCARRVYGTEDRRPDRWFSMMVCEVAPQAERGIRNDSIRCLLVVPQPILGFFETVKRGVICLLLSYLAC